MAHEDDDFTPWTSAGADRLRAEARSAAAALIEHAETVAALGEHDFVELVAAGGRLMPFLLALSDAQFAYTGNGGPLGPLRAWNRNEDEDEGGEPWHGTALSVLQRTDYRVIDESAVIQAGRAAYREAWPDDTADDAVADVTGIGRALYQIAHASGSWSSIDDVAGIEIAGRAILAVSTDELLGSNVDDWPEDLFDHDVTRVMYRQDDVYLP
ncbi:MAG TPA: hypothetical protein VL294_03805 [Pseudolysinimonas sp.]|jgi:hypothetical protein|nr:hypothetical protein [Pseudolysinimonas sp.]